jgi:hypothetical protein
MMRNKFQFSVDSVNSAWVDRAISPASIEASLVALVSEIFDKAKVTAKYNQRDEGYYKLSDHIRNYTVVCDIEDDEMDAEEFSETVEALRKYLKSRKGIEI